MSTGVLSSPASHKGRLLDCRFCQHLANPGEAGEEWAVVAETEHLVAVPSVGSLLSGWLLVLPKEHDLNFAAATDRSSRIESELTGLAADWEAVFGPLTWFEHGPKETDSAVGCSIDHAHMHLVPLGELNLLDAARSMLKMRFNPVGALSEATQAIDQDCSYLYLQLPNNTQWLAASNSIPSQSLRRVIAAEQGREDEWDWKKFPRHDLVTKTLTQAASLR
jgi:ATP adenylyltransferase